MLPYTMGLIDVRINQQISQQNTPRNRPSARERVAHAIYQFYPLAIPVIVILFILFFAWLVSAMGSMAGMRTKFRDVFSLMAACSLIPALQAIATYIVLRAKGDEITSQDQLTPPFGLDIFLQNIHGALLGLVNFFSIFEIWYLIVLTLALAYLGKSSKGKAFFAITPAWVLPLVIKVVQGMLQAELKDSSSIRLFAWRPLVLGLLALLLGHDQLGRRHRADAFARQPADFGWDIVLLGLLLAI